MQGTKSRDIVFLCILEAMEIAQTHFLYEEKFDVIGYFSSIIVVSLFVYIIYVFFSSDDV